MQPVVSVTQMPLLEDGIAREGVSLAELMRLAGTEVAHAAAHLMAELPGSEGTIVILAGPGNNGGDGWVAADVLAAHGYEVHVVSAILPDKIKSDIAREAALKVVELGLAITIDPDDYTLDQILTDAVIVVDAMLGTGSIGLVGEPYTRWIEAVDRHLHVKTVSVDVPTGFDGQTGEVADLCFVADKTVTMIALKPGLLSSAAQHVVGDLALAPLVDASELIDEYALAYTLEDHDYLGALPEFDDDVHKYSRGTVLVVGGSVQYPGAAILAAKAAARSGAGYVVLAVPHEIAELCRYKLDTIVVVGFDEHDPVKAFATLEPHLKKAHAVVAGPGMMPGSNTRVLMMRLLESDAACVIDAGGLASLAGLYHDDVALLKRLFDREAPTVLTPHVGELTRFLTQATRLEHLAERVEAAAKLMASFDQRDLVCVAKGSRTAVVSRDVRLIVEPGPSALASAGTGDVLSGMIGALLAQDAGYPEDVSRSVAAAVALHGRAGHQAVARVGRRGLIASDLLMEIGLACDQFEEDIIARCVERESELSQER